MYVLQCFTIASRWSRSKTCQLRASQLECAYLFASLNIFPTGFFSCCHCFSRNANAKCLSEHRCGCILLTFRPVLVLQVRPSLLASTAAVTVVPLLPPQPTSITPSLGTFLSVRNVISVVQGFTCYPERYLWDTAMHWEAVLLLKKKRKEKK